MKRINEFLRQFKLYRWWKGGVWTFHKSLDRWVHGRWMPYRLRYERPKQFIHDEDGTAYHFRNIDIAKLEDYA